MQAPIRDTSMNRLQMGYAVLAAMLLAGGARAQEDDDPKLSGRRPPAVAPGAPRKPARPPLAGEKEGPPRKPDNRPSDSPMARAARGEDPIARLVTVEETFGPPRSVWVRLVDGSSVAGLVHAERTGTLEIDCAFGLLSIPRERIAIIAYDAAAGSKELVRKK
jgi:hypothetical protein